MNHRNDFDTDPDAIPSDDDGEMSPWTLDELDDAADIGSLRQALIGAHAQSD